MFINTGAMYENGTRVKTKKELREALAAGTVVVFDKTSIFDSGTIRSTQLGHDVTLVVVLPDPYVSRKSYANVSRKADGTLAVK